MTEAAVSFAGNLTDDPRSTTPMAASLGPCSESPCRVGGCSGLGGVVGLGGGAY